MTRLPVINAADPLNATIAFLCGHHLVEQRGQVIGIQGWWGYRPLPDYITNHLAAFEMLLTLPRTTHYLIERLPEGWRVAIGTHTVENEFFSMAACDAFLQYHKHLHE